MENLRALVKSTILNAVPIPLVLKSMRLILAMPPSVAQRLVADYTTPTQQEEKWISRIKQDTWTGAWIAPGLGECTPQEVLERVKAADLIIYEVHGGGFRIGHCLMYMKHFITWLMLLKKKHGINAVVLSVEYGLAPLHKYPSQIYECMDAYRYLLEEINVLASKVVLVGDSAGGALCMETLMRFYAPNVINDINSPREYMKSTLPAGLALFSPLVSGNKDNWLWETNNHDIVSPMLAELVFKEYLDMPNKTKEEIPSFRLYTISTGFDRFFPKNISVYVGEQEVMRDDIIETANKIKKDSSFNIDIHRENLVHDWYFVQEIVPQEDRHLFEKYDHTFVDFMAKSIKEARETTELDQVAECLVSQPESTQLTPKLIFESSLLDPNVTLGEEDEKLAMIKSDTQIDIQPALYTTPQPVAA
ncbi:Alpha/Beta hydrolase protein [Phycomyces nitens]|nr:Alpha/Beta hydrolase protein [Phycomyces nitens]